MEADGIREFNEREDFEITIFAFVHGGGINKEINAFLSLGIKFYVQNSSTEMMRSMLDMR